MVVRVCSSEGVVVRVFSSGSEDVVVSEGVW